MKKFFLVLVLFIASIGANAAVECFNEGWKFNLADTPGAQHDGFSDKDWRCLNLPHDWALEEGYSMHGAQKDKGGYASGGIGWYRKSFEISAEQLSGGKHLFVDFEGAYMNSEVWVNGHYLGKRPYGYISFSYEITQYLKKGFNLIAVRIDNSLEPSARWYHGCGIYGNVELRTEEPTYFIPDGTFVTTPQITDSRGYVEISTEITSDVAVDNATLKCTITDSKGKEVASNNLEGISLAKGMQTYAIGTDVLSPSLWSPESPALYYAKLELVSNGGKVVGEKTTRFGFRTIEWKPETGFYLNGKQYKIRGVAEHMEGGPTGALTTEVLTRWKIKLLKDMGCNSIRTAHNPYLPIFYDMCDEMGILVLDEIFDGWMKKADYDYGMQAFDAWWERDMRAWLRRDRNHPSIFLYSVGNETHGEIGADLVRVCHEVDPTRKVTSGSADSKYMDVDGWNGGSENLGFVRSYKPDGKAYIGTENPHTWQTRAFYRTQTWYRNGYPSEKQKPEFIPNLTEKEIFGYDWTSPDKRRNYKQVFNPSYDNGTKTITARHSIQIMRETPWFSGGYRWTGFDYLGEAGYVHGGWPFRAFMGGALDLAGFEKDLYYLYQSEWTNTKMVHISPFWTHPVMKKGEPIPVRVYSTLKEVELFFNGKSLGIKKKGRNWDEMTFDWLVPWQEGTLEAVAYDRGRKVASQIMKSSGAPAQLGLSKWENRDLKADGVDVAIVTIEQQDEKGTQYPYGENRIYTKIYGGAKTLSFESGNPVDVETNYNAADKKCFFGLNRMFIQSTCKDSSKPVSVLFASINGDKKLMLSDKITIDVRSLALRGALESRNYTVRYTTDGSEPTMKSTLYTEPFSIKLGTTVKAIVCEGNEVVIKMSEEFSETDGIYWGTPGEEPCAFGGEQAEYATFTSASVGKKDGDGFAGEGYVIMKGKGSTITWYQENDSGAFDASIAFKYSQQHDDCRSTRMELWNNDKMLRVLEFKNTGSAASHWSDFNQTITLLPGANNIKLVAIDDKAPNFDQITVVQ